MTLQDDNFDRTVFIAPRRDPEPALVGDFATFIVVTKGVETVSRVEFGAAPLTIGRDASQSVVLVDTEVSRRHARVRLANGEAIVEDLGSTNGTFLNGQRLTAPAIWKEGSVLRVGSHLLKQERRSRAEAERSSALEHDLRRAGNYVVSLLPAPLTGGAVLTDWRFVPSAQLGGDAFGYYWLDPTTFVFYLLDVSGHGVGSAMHSVTVLNVLRQRALPQVDFANPAAVLASLNNRFQMDSHGGLFFTMWYGVYSTASRRLRYATAGHHAAYVVSGDRGRTEPLGMSALIIGIMPDVEYEVAEVTVEQNSTLYLFSDGIFEIVTSQGRWGLDDFEPLLSQPRLPGIPESERLLRAATLAADSRPFDDDASLMVLTFP